MHKTTILFGYPTDPAAFDRHYHEVHLPLTRKLKGIKGLTIGKLDASDNGEKAPYYVITSIYTDSREVLDATLATPDGGRQSSKIHQTSRLEDSPSYMMMKRCSFR